MSSILEALKKLEDEKASRRSGAGNMAGKVVASGRRPRPRPWWLLPAGMTAIAAAAVLATYALMGGFATPSAPARPAASAPPSQEHQAPAPAATMVPPLAPPPPLAELLPGKGAAVTPPFSPATPRAVQTPLPQAVPQQAPPRQGEESAAPPQPAAPVIPALHVAGIAWQKGSAGSYAVVNGRSVAEGATVEGARVERIFPDRVRFSIGNRSFEVALGQASGETP